ncbi:hypothetical protein QR680_003819 [Steinernema hermaphroditum]|uniref:Uncharacterized protein n=1 Tax=Steinernema hermaphroditum TaxID=289476 RepID=A0AA39HLN5_9BILA|nr:hypothetical protein QR680_003819 [Steinernema hermaphroditum]
MDPLLGCTLTILIISIGFIIWYLFVTVCLFNCLHKSPTFILLFSQALNDIYALSQCAWQPIISLAGVPEESFLPDRWLSVIHGSFELISLPHYIIIALNRALFLIDHTKMNIIFSRRNTIVICLTMWTIPLLANILLHIFSEEDDDGFYLFSTSHLEMGGDNLGLTLTSFLGLVSDLCFYATVVIVVVTYIIAIVWHSYKKRAFLSSSGSSSDGSSPSFGMEMRLTIVCLVNLVPPTITTIIEYTWADRGTAGSFIFALGTVGDNAVNSIVLPAFSQLLRECMKKKAKSILCARRTPEVQKVDPKLFERRRSTVTTFVPPA